MTTSSENTVARTEAVSQPPAQPAFTDIELVWKHFPDYPEYASGSSRTRWPPGFLGHLAKYIYCTNASPCPEYAIAAAIGFFAGVCGKGWNYSGTGLNHDIVIIGASGTGKNVIHEGLFNVMNQLTGTPVHMFIQSGFIASGPALIKACAANPCFLQIWGEVGKLYRAFARSRPGDQYDTLRTAKLDLWERSGPNGGSVGIIYSNQDNNVASVSGVAQSMLGESTAQVFYKAITEEMMADGTMSRLWIIEYDGEDPDLNTHKLDGMPPEYVDYLRGLVTTANQKLMAPTKVEHTPEAAELLSDFAELCRGQKRLAKDNESKRQQWTRAHEKVLRLAALLAVADNYIVPVIAREHVVWAQDLLLATNSNLNRRLSTGEIGGDSNSREAAVLNRMWRWIRNIHTEKDPKTKTLKENGIITRRFLQQETSRLEAFREYQPGGAPRALDETLKTMLDSGWIMEVKKDKLAGC